jgi:hypothetical protein
MQHHSPHIVIDSSHNTIPSLPSLWQQVTTELEGDFNTYFRVYAPSDYQRDLRQILPPDVMAALIDYGKLYDFELVDNYLYVYAPSDTTSHPDQLKALLHNSLYVAHKLDRQTHRYHDARIHRIDDRAAALSATPIAEEGRRLKIKSNTVGTIFMVVLCALMIWAMIQEFIKKFFSN